MRRVRTDTNHALVANAARGLGCTVADTSRVGGGFPDQVWGVAGLNLLIEVKFDHAYRPGEGGAKAGVLNELQTQFHAEWRGQVAVVHSLEDVGRLVKAARIQREIGAERNLEQTGRASG
jgi:hypothetical protein